MKRRWLGIVICVVALLAAGCSSDTDVSRAADESDIGTAVGKAFEATVGTAAVESEAGETAVETSAAKADPVGEKKAYVSSDWAQSALDGNRGESEDYMVLEYVWGTVQDAVAYKGDHIKGAYHMDMDDTESEEYRNTRTPEEIKDLMAEYGITKDTMVICYSNRDTNSADDRVALTLLQVGVENVKYLGDSCKAWFKSGYGTEKTVNTPQSFDREFGVDIPIYLEYILSIDEVKDRLARDDSSKLVNIRSRDEFLDGTSEYGHIDRMGEPEGAVQRHDTDNGSYHNEDGTIADLSALKGYLEEPDVSLDSELSFYCSTGWRATVPFLICYENRMTNTTVHDGGWYQWQMDGSLPIQVGDPAENSCQFTTMGELSIDKAKK